MRSYFSAAFIEQIIAFLSILQHVIYLKSRLRSYNPSTDRPPKRRQASWSRDRCAAGSNHSPPLKPSIREGERRRGQLLQTNLSGLFSFRFLSSFIFPSRGEQSFLPNHAAPMTFIPSLSRCSFLHPQVRDCLFPSQIFKPPFR